MVKSGYTFSNGRAEIESLVKEMPEFKKVLDKKYDSLAGSAKFKRLRAAAKEVGVRQWPSSTYTSIGDEDITIDPYISKLERLLAPAN